MDLLFIEQTFTLRVITAPYTISSADTWERKIITIPGDTAGAAITNDTAERFRLMWGLNAGANFNTASASWGNYSSANLLGGHVTNSLVTTNNATFELTERSVGGRVTFSRRLNIEPIKMSFKGVKDIMNNMNLVTLLWEGILLVQVME